MGLATKSSYILACYASLAEKYGWKAAGAACECGDTDYDEGKEEESRHLCPMHRDFKPSLRCSAHLECNDPVTRCFLLAKACADLADDCHEYSAEYRDMRK